MRCLSCQREVTSKSAKLWLRKILVCPGCHELADKAKAEMDAAHRRAQDQALIYLEQHVLNGGLLHKGSGMELPGIGKVPDAAI